MNGYHHFKIQRQEPKSFDKAAALGGYRSLTVFVMVTLLKKAKEIVEENELTIASQMDKEIFFDSLLNPPKPNNELLSAKGKYNKDGFEMIY